MLAEENVVDLSEEDKEKLTELDALTGEGKRGERRGGAFPQCSIYLADYAYVSLLIVSGHTLYRPYDVP
jgi:hypothetical protein